MKSFIFLVVLGSLLKGGRNDFCDDISTKDTDSNSCKNLETARTCKADVFVWLMMTELAGKDLLHCGIHCTSESTVRWHTECMLIMVNSAREQFVNLSLTPLQLEPSSSKSVDFLFLMEVNCQNYYHVVDKLLRSIQSLMEMTSNAKIFHDVITQVGVVLYYNNEYVYARDFSVEAPSDIRVALTAALGECNGSETCLSSYGAIDAGLRATAKASNLGIKDHRFHQTFRLVNKTSVRLWHRPYSDLHIVTVLSSGDGCHGNNSVDGGRAENSSIDRSIDRLLGKSDQLKNRPVSFHFAFSTSNSPAISLVGDPSLAIRYSDCSHFRKAPTLKALIAAGLGSSLQAILLSKGTEFQSHFLDDVENPSCILKTCPLLSTLIGVLPSFPEKCLLASRKRQGAHTRDLFCSSLHGWTEKPAESDADFSDVVPLSGKYGASHADLAVSMPAEKATGRVELSISKKVVGERRERVQKPAISGQPRVMWWKHEKPFVNEMRKEPMVLRGTVVETWSAFQTWNMSYLSSNMDAKVLDLVKCTNEYLTFDQDRNSPLKLNISLPYSLANMSTSDFFECVESGETCNDGFLGHYYFGSIPESLKKDVQPVDFLYRTKKDQEAGKQFMWISSAGMTTHTHFDQDYNFFVQLVGEKRFTLWSPEQHELLYVYPRVHPLWHKSRVNFREVDVQRFPAFSRATAVQVKLGPGDVLYVPPYTWHYVETLTPSVSLSTWSHDYALYDHMNAVYRHDHKFDLLQSRRGQMFVLRLYLDMMVHDLYGFNETAQFFARLLHNRFSGLENHFPPSEDDPAICESSVPDKIPTCVHVHGYAKLDAGVIGPHFQALDQTVRDILFCDYVEEIAAQVVGVRKILAFFRYCFLGQTYYVTDMDSEEHLLWEHKDVVDD